MGDRQGRTALITGASKGIGAATARALADAGVNLALASRSGVGLGIEGAVAMSVDIRDRAALEKLAAATAGRFGGIDRLDGSRWY